MEPVDRGFRAAIERLPLPLPVHWITNNAFLWSREAFAAWATPYKQLRMRSCLYGVAQAANASRLHRNALFVIQ